MNLTLDTRVPAELLRLIEGKIIDDDSLDAWVALPGNAELLRIGRVRGELGTEQLREELWHSILGHAGAGERGMGSLDFEPLLDLNLMLEELARRDRDTRERVLAMVAPYLPGRVHPLDATVMFHLGGTWSGRTSTDIYVSLSFLHSFAPPWLDAVDSIIAHEVIHKAHLQVGPLPAEASTAEGSFGVALSQIQAEGIARHVEYQLLDGAYPEGSYGAFARGRYADALGGFHAAFARLEEIREACLRRLDMDGCRDLIRRGLIRGGATYAIGHGMASAIESALGRGSLASTLASGPEAFFDLYVQATRMLPGFPVPGPGFDEDLRLAGRWLDNERRIWRFRKEAREAHGKRAFDRAAALLEELLALSPRSPMDAYNLSCALARAGEKKKALEWLERAVDYGYRDGAFLSSDPDLDGLRGRRVYSRLLERLGAAPSPPNSSMK